MSHGKGAAAPTTISRLRSRGRDEHGVVMVIVAILMTVFLGMAALAIDLGSFWQAQRQAQAAADAGALAASQDLPSSTARAATDGTTYAVNNFPGATATVVTPYNSSTNQVKVTVNATTPSFFGHIFGVTKANVSASAVAGAGTAAGAKTAIFAKSSACGSSILLQQSDMTLSGGVHSNGGIVSAAHNSSYTSGSMGPAPCGYTENGGSNTYGGSPTPTVDPVAQPWPEDYTADFPTLPLTTANDPNCKWVYSDLNLQNDTGLTLVSGTYCAQTIEFNSSNMSCTCSFVASQSMQFNQGPDNFTPSFKDLGFYDMQSGPVNLNANGFDFLNSQGSTLFLPFADVTVNAPSGNVYSALEAQTVQVNGGGPTTWHGSGTPVGGASTPSSLVQ